MENGIIESRLYSQFPSFPIFGSAYDFFVCHFVNKTWLASSVLSVRECPGHYSLRYIPHLFKHIIVRLLPLLIVLMFSTSVIVTHALKVDMLLMISYLMMSAVFSLSCIYVLWEGHLIGCTNILRYIELSIFLSGNRQLIVLLS